ncbi:MAG: efflux RND transporter periplasmic adaptor subunit [Alphaproteobacteria bacterium]|nr:efflux RND transporter periplasmic adaptor subunit [Alphaproteobacteria bacterium]
MLRAIVSFVVVGVFGALFAGAYWIFLAEAKPAGGGFGMPGGFAVPVEIAEVTASTSKKSVVAIGTLASSESVVVRSEVAGRIASLDIPEGQPVKEGAVLVKLDPSVELAALRQAKASLDLARANFKRADELMKRGSGTARSLDEARAGLKAGEATVALMEAQLERMTVIAPFAGVLGLKRVALGDYLAPGAEIINIEKIDPLRVEFRVPEVFLPMVKTGSNVILAVDAYPGREFQGQVYAIDPKIDEAGRSIVIRASVPNQSGELKPGLFARVTLDLVVKEGALFVPEESIVPIGNDRFVYKVVDFKDPNDGKEGKKVAFTPVKIGQRTRGQVEIAEGLVPKDVVVTAGVLKIYDGAAVMPIPAPPPDGPAPAQPAPEQKPAEKAGG